MATPTNLSQECHWSYIQIYESMGIILNQSTTHSYILSRYCFSSYFEISINTIGFHKACSYMLSFVLIYIHDLPSLPHNPVSSFNIQCSSSFFYITGILLSLWLYFLFGLWDTRLPYVSFTLASLWLEAPKYNLGWRSHYWFWLAYFS